MNIASDASQGPMYGHGFATLFLGEIYGMTGDDAVKEKLQKAIKLIEKTQNSEGGWRYQPAKGDADISVIGHAPSHITLPVSEPIPVTPHTSIRSRRPASRSCPSTGASTCCGGASAAEDQSPGPTVTPLRAR